MGLTVTDIVMMGLGTVLMIFIIFLSIRGKKYDYLFETLDANEFKLKEIYSIGYALTEILHMDFQNDNNKQNQKLRQELKVLFDEKYTEYYLRVIYAQCISIFLVLLQVAFIFYALSRDISVFAIMAVLAATVAYYFFSSVDKKIAKRSEALLSDFSDAVSNLALLTNAGMILREAWEATAATGEGLLYKEMEKTCEDMRNGVSDIEAIRRFGVRCIIPEIKKFSSTLIQGMEKGNKELAAALRGQSDELWEMKKQSVKRQGETAASKLLLPMIIMFIGVLIIIIVPVFANMGI